MPLTVEPDEKAAATAAGDDNASTEVAAGLPVPLLEKSARVTLNGNRPIYEVFTVDCFDGKRLHVALAQSDAKKEATVREVLQDVGAALPENVAQAKFLAARLVEAAPASAGGQITTRWGWFRPGRVYVLNNTWIIPSKVKDKPGKASFKARDGLSFSCAHFDESRDWNILGPEALTSNTDGVFGRAGSLKEWQESIGKIATYSSVLRLVVALPLAAPLVAMLNAERFMVMLTGPSSRGKTTAETAAGSVIGKQSADDLPNWNISDPRLEQVGRFHNDNLLIIDDLKTAGGSDKEKFQTFQHRIHWFTSGGRRGRLPNAVAKITGRSDAHLSIRTLVLSSYEYPVAEIAKRANGSFDPGDLVRTLDIEASPPGAVLIFDALPEAASKDSPEAYAERLLAEIREGSREHHGVLYDAWVRALIANPDFATGFVKRAMKEFMSAAGLQSANPQEKRHAEHFALIYGAGAYAIYLGLLTWSDKRFKKAILKCHTRARKRLRAALSGLDDGLARLDSRLRDPARVTAWPQSGRPQVAQQTDGWARDAGQDLEYYIIGAKFRQWFSSRPERKLIVDRLKVAGWLKSTQKGPTTDLRVGAGTTKVKCYHLVIPKGVAAAQL